MMAAHREADTDDQNDYGLVIVLEAIPLLSVGVFVFPMVSVLICAMRSGLEQQSSIVPEPAFRRRQNASLPKSAVTKADVSVRSDAFVAC
jgi:hypothetical protein